MSWAPRKRFWAEVTVRAGPEGFAVLLDARPLQTPAKRPLVVPSAPLAGAIADEWRSIEAEIDPDRLPFTRAANTAIDRVADDRDKVIDSVAAYGEADLICYRAEGPEGLRRRQAAAWDPWLDWSARTLAAPLIVVTGVMHQPQPETSLARLRAAVAAHDALELTALYDLVTLSGSLVLGLAVSLDVLGAAGAWNLARLDETWQAELWGEDADAEIVATAKAGAFLQARTLLSLLRRGESDA